jgi:uncharacterized FAD-dependent dehydrogenase
LSKIRKNITPVLQANINEDSAARVANTLEPMEKIQDSVRIDRGLPETPGYRSAGYPEGAVLQVIKDLMQISRSNQQQIGRKGHPSFQDFASNLLRNLDCRDLHSWMKGLFKTWKPIYELNRVQ